VGIPLEPETAIVTKSDCEVVMVEAAGVTLTVGVEGWVEVEPDPPPQAEIFKTIRMKRKGLDQIGMKLPLFMVVNRFALVATASNPAS
jgi:hypothetical protein